jgi:putative colanic acid biosynthesis acetyltransferase WcaF
MGIDLSVYRNRLGWRNQLGRVIWQTVWALMYWPSPRPMHGWRRFLLRCFGAKVGRGAHPYPAAKIWAPWNLEMGDHSSIADGAECYSVDKIVLGASSIVSQGAYLCTATHDYQDRAFPLVTAPITIGPGAWVAAQAFVGPGVVVGEEAIVGARACVFKDVEPGTIVGGNPARFIKRRDLKSS